MLTFGNSGVGGGNVDKPLRGDGGNGGNPSAQSDSLSVSPYIGAFKSLSPESLICLIIFSTVWIRRGGRLNTGGVGAVVVLPELVDGGDGVFDLLDMVKKKIKRLELKRQRNEL